jgi:hypothetical protein
MTDAEQAVVDVLEGGSACTWHVGCDVEDCYGPRAQAIVAAVRPLIEAEALEALADGAAAYGPPTADQLRGIAFMVRKGLKPIRAWLDADESLRTTTSEHKGGQR